MGDRKRHTVFAKFIKRNYPRVKRILCVAEGTGYLGSELVELGYKVRCIEAKPRLKVRPRKGLVYHKGWFTEDTDVDEDLIIGMHPDEATTEIVLAAKKIGAPWAIVPCCIKGRRSKGIKSFPAWLKMLGTLDNGSSLSTTLDIRGRNTVLYKKR